MGRCSRGCIDIRVGWERKKREKRGAGRDETGDRMGCRDTLYD
jgi:hypothetical protein